MFDLLNLIICADDAIIFDSDKDTIALILPSIWAMRKIDWFQANNYLLTCTRLIS